MPRLYQSIYLTILASLIAVVLAAAAMWRFAGPRGPVGEGSVLASEFVAASVPDANLPEAEQQRAIEALSARTRADITLYNAARRPVASAGRPTPPPDSRAEPVTIAHDRYGPAWSVRLPDGRWMVARLPRPLPNPIVGLVVSLGLVAGIVALCAFPVVRGVTRRLERLQQGVETLGAGDFRARVKVEGKDEVAQLARSFNVAAGRVEELVGAHRMLLANASHELRTPLARLKLGLELLQSTGDGKYRESLSDDIRELDDLLEEILVASRLETLAGPRETETLDLLALVAEECAHYDEAVLAGVSVRVSGDPRLLRRLVRNLLENARRHGQPPTEVILREEAGKAVLEVVDAGPGVPPPERERVFEPFYQSRGATRGSGLGLALVRRIARLHGGDARVVGVDGGGRFEVTLAMA